VETKRAVELAAKTAEIKSANVPKEKAQKG
jgi:hypothetical protein